MKRLFRSRGFLAALFGVTGAFAALALTGNLPGQSEDEEPKSIRIVERSSKAGRAFTSSTPAPSTRRAEYSDRRSSSYSYERDDYYDRLYEQYFGESEDSDEDDYVYVPPEGNGGGPGTPGEPGQPGIPDDGEGDGQGGPAGPGGAAGDG